ncbi:4-phosphoerythronate dehydrogenase PdxB [Lentisphaerota bacterium ZTH]|nr:4-phosphoerythronate dehydrogenase PdxB [Lentisphaerota bacterium]WET06648.1 4-phosphoerythronate dehydrogenase PdxB [Lentisphaerota bacterium ZTH]
MKIIADDKIPFLRGVLENYAEVIYLPGAKVAPEIVKDADAMITRTRTQCNSTLLQGSKVKFIATATIGFDHIDTKWVEANGISWTNAPGCNSSSVAQYITSALLNLAVKHKIGLKGKTLGIAGVGNVGSKVAEVGKALGMRVLLNDPPRAEQEGTENFVSLNRIISESDFVTMHVPLEKAGSYPTFHLANSDLFNAMKSTAFYINTSRGPVCDNHALKTALQTGQIAGAVLDVWENEPALDQELLNLVDYSTPHIAGYSYDGKANGTAMSVNALAGFFKLPLKNWYPNDIPVPKNTDIAIPDEGSFEEKILKAVNLSYDIRQDSDRLRRSPETFEKQRGDYPLRREFPIFSTCCIIPEVSSALEKLGFNIL